MQALPHTHSCFVCGESNPLGLRLRFETDGRIVRGRFIPRPEHIGFKRVVHGGIIATLLDEIMVWACAVRTKRFAFCAEMTVRYQSPLAPREEVVVEAELTANRRGRIFEAKAELKNASGRVLAGAIGKYIPVKSTDLADMVTDFVGDPRWIFDTSPVSPDER
jgi:acyl-coenzyme A thioesterase PaaI-like protein